VAAVDARALHRDALVVDAHVHPHDFVPALPRAAYRLVNRRTMPAAVGFDVLRPAGVNVAVAKAVGDPVVTRWYRGGPWAAVQAQLDRVEAAARAAGASLAADVTAVRRARNGAPPVIVLGLEGADALEGDVARLDTLHARGVRVVVPVHLGDNDIGTTCLPWQQYVGPLPVRRRRPGLTDFGAAVIRRMNELGMVIDVSHADRQTMFDIVDASTHPVIASHSGARACDDFARYLADDELGAIARTGGVVGLWPYRHRRHGVPDVPSLVQHARHVAGLVGPEHLCIGTDMNGVPGVMAGYRDERDLPVVTAALLDDGFAPTDVEGILGANVLRVLEAVTGPS